VAGFLTPVRDGETATQMASDSGSECLARIAASDHQHNLVLKLFHTEPSTSNYAVIRPCFRLKSSINEVPFFSTTSGQ
jgi:hypothetical protein